MKDTIRSLANKFPTNEFVHQVISITDLVRFISYNGYFRYLYKHKLLVLSTPGFTTLSWHVTAIAYCLKYRIRTVADGLTRDLMHFPGHMDTVIGIFRQLYEDFEITYQSPVRDWEVPADQQFIDRLIVDPHGYFFPSEESSASMRRTTGHYLYKLGLLPHSNVKGSPLDHRMQYDCYPFVLYNIMIFWIYLNFHPYEYLAHRMKSLFEEKTNNMRDLLKKWAANEKGSRLSELLSEVVAR